MLTLRKIGNHRVMIYIYIVVLESLMLHPSIVEIGRPVMEKIFDGFLPYMDMAAILVM